LTHQTRFRDTAAPVSPRAPADILETRAGGAHAHYPTVLLLHGTASQKDEVGDMYLRLAHALGLVGFSQGGRVAATVAGTDPRVKVVATWSTWDEDGSTAYLLYGPDAYHEAQLHGQVTVDLGFRTWTFSLAFFDSIKNSHPLEDIANYHGPLLGIDGSEDVLWPQTKDELYAAGSYDETLHVVPGADHIHHVLDPDQTQAEDVMNTTANWFSQKLAPDVHNGH
jgi:dienelactone hydrolase